MPENQDDSWQPDDEWPDPDPSPPLVEQAVEWLKRSTKTFLNLFGGYIFMVCAWMVFLVASFYFSFLLVGASQTVGTNAGIWELMRIGAHAVMTNLRPLGEVMGGFVGSVSLIMFVGGAISLWAYLKLKKLGGWVWEWMTDRIR